MKRILLFMFLVLSVLSYGTSKKTMPNEDEFINPIMRNQEGPDPYVLKYTDGYYYGMHTVMEGGYSPKLVLYRHKTLSDLYTKGEKKFVFQAPIGQNK